MSRAIEPLNNFYVQYRIRLVSKIHNLLDIVFVVVNGTIDYKFREAKFREANYREAKFREANSAPRFVLVIL